ncbi:MAG: hypothetical protein AAGG01_08155 [Planctomycetota bacterium]
MGQTQGTSNDPEIIVIGGPNGAGKTTTAARILPYGLDVGSFVNADCIAAGISPHDPDDAAILAGREMLLRLRSLREARADFSFESTLAPRGSRGFSERRERRATASGLAM